MRKEPLITKIILWSIIIIPIIILIINEVKYKDLGYDIGEFTGYILEIKRYTDTTVYETIDEIYYTSSKVKQSYNVKENDYISESLGKNLEKKNETLDNALDSRKNTINSSNRIILSVKQLNQTDATISVLRLNGYEEITLKYGKSYKFIVGSSTYTIKLNKSKI